MEHKGVRYAIRIGIEREKWRVVIHFPSNSSPEERTVFGTREDAQNAARSRINAWLKKRSAPAKDRTHVATLATFDSREKDDL